MALSQFVQDVLAKIPEENRAAVAEALAEGSEAVQYLEAGASRQADYSRHMDAIRRTHEEQVAWYNQNKALLDEALAARATRGNPNPNPEPTSALPADVIRKGDLEKFVNEREAGALAVITVASTLGARHLHEFGEVLDMNNLVNDPKVKELGLMKGYEALYAERYKAKQDQAEAARINGLVEARVTEELRKRGSTNVPYPVAGADVGSPLDALTSTEKPDPSQYSADAAADEYTQLAAQRTH